MMRWACEPRNTSTTVDLPAVRPSPAMRRTQLTTFCASTVASCSSTSVEQLEQCSQRKGVSVWPKYRSRYERKQSVVVQ